jgi:hypothetical protein
MTGDGSQAIGAARHDRMQHLPELGEKSFRMRRYFSISKINWYLANPQLASLPVAIATLRNG